MSAALLPAPAPAPASTELAVAPAAGRAGRRPAALAALVLVTLARTLLLPPLVAASVVECCLSA